MKVSEALVLRGEPDSYERQENVWLLEHILGATVFTQLKYQPDAVLTAPQLETYQAGLQRLDEGEPLAYVTGSQPFWTLDLNVTPDTLVPRPDTEILIETVLQLPLAEQAQVVDLGTGTGAIALSLASERPKWLVTATDIYPATLLVAKQNASKYQLPVSFACGSWFEALNNTSEKYDLVVSNPPYIDANDPHMKGLTTEPRRALVADEHGLADFKLISAQAPQWLKPNGWIVFEHGYDQGQAVQGILLENGFLNVRTVKDYGGNDRVTLGQLVI